MRRFLVAIFALFVACSDSSGPETDPNPDDLIDAVASAFSEADVARYDTMLAPDFHYEFEPREKDLAGTPDGRWDREQSLDVFALLVAPPMAEGVAPSQILASSFTPVDESWNAWTDGEFVGALHRAYDVMLHVREFDGDEFTTYTRGDFTVAEINGRYRLLHWAEQEPIQARGFLGFGWLQASVFRRHLDREIVQRLRTAFVSRAFLQYDGLRHADFLFEFAPADIEASGTTNGIWDRARDSASAESMFSGVTSSPTALAIDEISFELAPLSIAWTRNELPEAQSGWYMRFELSASFTTNQLEIFNVLGMQELHVKRTEAGYQLVYWRDQGQVDVGSLELRAIVGFSMGAMKARY